jgi:poly[(R)-3-hydroxyalkanoate] polymerase subunit PhaC
MSEQVQDTGRDGDGSRERKSASQARTPRRRDREPAAVGQRDGDATAPDSRQGRAGEDADHVAAAVGGGEAIGPAGAIGGLDPLRLLGGFRDLMDPGNMTRETARLMLELTEVAVGTSDVSIPEKDKRFADPAWRENPVYRRIGQTYLAWSAAVDRLANAPELQSDWRRLAQARYTGALLTATAAPTNFLPGNPAALSGRSTPAG